MVEATVIPLNPRSFLAAGITTLTFTLTLPPSLPEYASAAVLVSLCVVLGRVTILQLVIMAVIEVAVFTANEFLAREVAELLMLRTKFECPRRGDC